MGGLLVATTLTAIRIGDNLLLVSFLGDLRCLGTHRFCRRGTNEKTVFLLKLKQSRIVFVSEVFIKIRVMMLSRRVLEI